MVSFESQSDSSHMELGEFIVSYKYIQDKDSFYCPVECRIINLNTKNQYYFFPNRNLNAAVLSENKELESIFSAKEIYLNGDNKFLLFKNSDTCYVNIFNKVGPDSSLTKITSNILFGDSFNSGVLYISFKMKGIINVYQNEFIINSYEQKKQHNGIDEAYFEYSMYRCMFFNKDVKDVFAVMNNATDFLPLDQPSMKFLGISPSAISYFYMKPLAF